MMRAVSRGAIVVSDGDLPAVKERSSLHYALVGAKHFLKSDVLMPAFRGVKWFVRKYFKPIVLLNFSLLINIISFYACSLYACLEAFLLAWLFGILFGGAAFGIVYFISLLFSFVAMLIYTLTTAGNSGSLTSMVLTCGSISYCVCNGFRKLYNYLGDCYAHLAETGKHLEITSNDETKSD